MHRQTLHRPVVLALSLVLPLLCGTAQAYQETEQQYDALGEQLPPWDHDGNLPEGDSRLFELQKMREQLFDRQHRLTVSLFVLNGMEAQVKDPSRYASLRRDYQTQLESFARWKESMERRRQAILESTNLHPKYQGENPDLVK